jgi:hypothetical protein
MDVNEHERLSNYMMWMNMRDYPTIWCEWTWETIQLYDVNEHERLSNYMMWMNMRDYPTICLDTN